MTLPIGTLVDYWKGAKRGLPSGRARTRTRVHNTSNGDAIVWIEGEPGWIMLTHIQIVDDLSLGESECPDRTLPPGVL